jgi:hypothetical protein
MVDRERGQLVLIGAVTVAIALLGAVILLNTVHSSPDAIAETDSRSVDNAESTIQEIERDLEMVALNRSGPAPRPLPYVANSTELNQSVDRYQVEYLNLSTKDTSELVSIEYNKVKSDTSDLSYGNFSSSGDKIVANGINELSGEENSFVLITHYQRILNYVVPDYVHIMMDGKIIKSGDKELAKKLEDEGYEWVAEHSPVAVNGES